MIDETLNNASQFRDEFHAYNRGDQFSYEALGAMFTYFEDMSESIGEDMQLDVIAVCCDYMEYNSLAEALGDYDHIDTLEELRDHTMVLELDSGSLVVQQM